MNGVPYIYEARLLRVVDGDTYDLTIDVGFRMTCTTRVRLSGWDTPELYPRIARLSGLDTPELYPRIAEQEHEAAQRATQVARSWFDEHEGFLVRTTKDDAFGRWLAQCFTEGSDLGEHLHEAGLAVRWPDRWRDVHGGAS